MCVVGASCVTLLLAFVLYQSADGGRVLSRPLVTATHYSISCGAAHAPLVVIPVVIVFVVLNLDVVHRLETVCQET